MNEGIGIAHFGFVGADIAVTDQRERQAFRLELEQHVVAGGVVLIVQQVPGVVVARVVLELQRPPGTADRVGDVAAEASQKEDQRFGPIHRHGAEVRSIRMSQLKQQCHIIAGHDSLKYFLHMRLQDPPIASVRRVIAIFLLILLDRIIQRADLHPGFGIPRSRDRPHCGGDEEGGQDPDDHDHHHDLDEGEAELGGMTGIHSVRRIHLRSFHGEVVHLLGQSGDQFDQRHE